MGNNAGQEFEFLEFEKSTDMHPYPYKKCFGAAFRLVSIFILAAMLSFIFGHQSSQAYEKSSCEIYENQEMSGDVSLAGQCIYNSQISIVSSNTHLNCNGAIFDGKGKLPVGLTITSRGKPLENITVENCKFQNFTKHGIFITAGIPDYKKHGSREELYFTSPRKVTLTKIASENNGRSGLYVDDYVTQITLQESIIRGSGKSAIYLEHSSTLNVIRNNLIEGNGFSLDDGSLREGIAVDSSSRNTIEENQFVGNAAGGIFLYKNCGEKASTGKSVPRWQPSDNNLVRRNSFKNERVGVWIASRQSKNLSKWDCSDQAMDQSRQYFEDFANNNLVEHNEFCATKVGIRIEGDKNQISNNRFDEHTKIDVEVPRTKRETLLGRPPLGNRVTGNLYVPCEKQ